MHKNNAKYGQYIFVPFMIGGKLKGTVEVSSDKGTDKGASDEELKEIAVRTISPYVQQISRMYTLGELMKAGLGSGGVRNETEKTPKGSKKIAPIS